MTDAEGATSSITAEYIILATGSVPIELPFLPFDGEKIVSSDHAIAFESVPKRLVIVGGGVIGLEMSSIWARLGSEVTVIEYLDQVATGFDKDGAKGLQQSLAKLGINFQLKTKVTGTAKKGKGMVVQAEQGDEKLEFAADKVLVAVGRRPFTEGVGLDTVGIATDERGVSALTNISKPHTRTSTPWAI